MQQYARIFAVHRSQETVLVLRDVTGIFCWPRYRLCKPFSPLCSPYIHEGKKRPRTAKAY